MFGKRSVSRWLVAAALIATLEGVTAAGVMVALTAPADAQWFSSEQRRQRPQRGPSFFESLFGGGSDSRSGAGGSRQQAGDQPADNSYNAPAPRKADKDAPPPTTSIVVMGDSMADWLAYGLEDAFADAPEIGVVRKHKHFSGLLRYDSKNDLDWWHVVKDILANEHPNYVVMMLGVHDRQNIRERDLAKEAEKKAKETEEEKKNTDSGANATAANQDADKKAAEERDAIIAAEPRGRAAGGVIEFRSERWAQVYSRRIDDTIAALKSKGVPVFWVGLPAIRGTKSTADTVYLNDLYRQRAERAGIVYIDVWDGFVDEQGRFVTFGPDFEGQNRRLRAGDGVYFTKSGSRKLAHYVEREIRRYMSNRGPIALPSGPMGPIPSDGKPAARPLVGPVVPLTTTPANADALLGGAGGGGAVGDAIATQVLVKGDAVYAPYGRADDFVWPRSETNRPKPPETAVTAPPAPNANASAALPPPVQPAIAAPEPQRTPRASPAPQTSRQPPNNEPARTVQTARPRPVEPRAEARPPSNVPPRPQAPVRAQPQPPRGGLFDLFR